MRWYRDIPPAEKRTLRACFAGWAVDAADTQIFSLVIPTLLTVWGISKGQAGLIGGATLVAGALGGLLAGMLSDRVGRVRALQVTVLWFSLFTFLSAFAQNFEQLLALKALQGIGFGGEWTAGAVLLSETIDARHRGKAMGIVQSAWGFGWGAAVLLYTAMFSFVSQEWAWRLLFAVGVAPALLVLYLRRKVAEPPRERAAAREAGRPGVLATAAGIFAPAVLRTTVVGGLIGLGAHGGYYAVTTWLPTYLKTERHLSVLGTGGYLAVVIVAFIAGCFASAWLQDRIGRRRTVIVFAIGCTVMVNLYTRLPIGDTAMLILSFPLGLLSAGIPAALGALFNELYPQGVRGTGVGFCYNFGRIVSAGFPVLIGHMSSTMSLGTALGIDAGLAYGLVVVAALLLPETRGRCIAAPLPGGSRAGPQGASPATPVEPT
ncbi:MFS transporter [Burkholderia glumae]|uniref:MFS transporter n=1 Tax=Burkholderia glumae TaxID=337 RepID=UPI000F5EBE6A|nr:MFS transporter [Burkholderia glumae]MCM2494959.1 MFS transporter [Burkholderia glumae]MCM2545824.1 MFS transporter [Burkholderia glumae]MCQ0030938.1 MFS transporter [Burkholderia glumae]MCQ0038109.1 MFS transporter [Burkholderia glumae]QJW81596.1 MFS transporter [Burkholderia glumae]